MPNPPIDVVTVYHREKNRAQAMELERQVAHYEPDVNFIAVSNMRTNRGFGRACNLGAKEGDAPIIGFINPDARVQGKFVSRVQKWLEQPDTVITGERYGKSAQEIKLWGCNDWVVGACFFVRRDWFESVGGFDERYVMYFEETDLIRTAEQQGKRARSIRLPIVHRSPTDDTPEDKAFKEHHFTRSARLYWGKWGR